MLLLTMFTVIYLSPSSCIFSLQYFLGDNNVPHTCMWKWEQTLGSCFPLHNGLWGLSAGQQAWQRAPLPALRHPTCSYSVLLYTLHFVFIWPRTRPNLNSPLFPPIFSLLHFVVTGQSVFCCCIYLCLPKVWLSLVPVCPLTKNLGLNLLNYTKNSTRKGQGFLYRNL